MTDVEAPTLAPSNDTPPIATVTPTLLQPDTKQPIPIPQASLDSAAGEGSLTEAAARVRAITRAAYGQITTLLGSKAIAPDASTEDVLKSIKAKNPDKSFQDSELVPEIELALEEAKQLRKEKPAMQESNLPVESVAEISDHIKTAWTGDGITKGAVHLIIAASEKKVWGDSHEKFYAVARRLKHIDVALDKAEKAVQEKIDQALRKADVKRVGQAQMPMDEQERTSFIEQYKNDHQEELENIEKQYYEFDRNTSTYTLKIGLDGKHLQPSQFEKISTFSNVKDAMEALRDLAAQTDANGKPTTETLDAKKVLPTLEKYLNVEKNGFEPLTEAERAGRKVVTYTYRLFDALLEPFGQKLDYEDAEIEIGGKKTKRKRLKLDVLTKIDPTCKTGEFGELGSRLSRLAVLLNEYETVDVKEHPDAKAYLAAMIYDEAAQIDISRITSSIHPDLAREFTALSSHTDILHQYRDNLLEKVKGVIYQYYYPNQPLDPKKLQDIVLSGPHLFRILYFANACEGHVGINPETNELDMEAPLKGILNKSMVAGEIFKSDITAIMRLAGSKQAGTILKNELGFDLDRLKDQPITAYANRVIAGIDAKRPDDKKMTPKERENYYKVFEELQIQGEEKGKGSKLSGLITAFGLIALILGPSFMKMFEEGSAGGQQEQQPG